MQKEIVQDGSGNYLRVTGTQEEDLGDKIFTYQDIKGFLPLEVRWINGQKEYIYNISGRLSLKKYLDRGDFSLQDIQRLFWQIFDMADCMEEYLLDSRGVVIQEDFLYLDTATGDWEGIYSRENHQASAEAVGKLLETIMEKMNQNDKELVFFVYGMHRITRGTDCTRNMLREYLSEAGTGGPSEQQEPEEQMSVLSREPPIPDQKGEFLPAKQRCSHRRSSIRDCLLPTMVLAAGIVVPIILWWRGMFRLPLSGETDRMKAAAATMFFLAVAGYGAWRTMPGRSGNHEKKGLRFQKENSSENKVCLIPQNGSGNMVLVGRFPYRIGEEGTDKNRQIYAHILQEAGTVMIVDEESDQGTFHNDRRLVPWQKTPLRDGDLLRIGDKEYVVEITQPEYVM